MKIVRILFYTAFFVGVGLFLAQYLKTKAARDTFNKAVAAINQQRYTEAITLLDTVAPAAPDDAELRDAVPAHYAKAFAAEGERLIDARNYTEAYRLLSDIRTKCPEAAKSTTAYRSLAKACMETDRLDEAVAAARIAAAVPDDREAQLISKLAEKKKKALELAEAAKAARGAKDTRTAIAKYEELVADPTLAGPVTGKYHPYYYLAELYLAQGAADKAADMLKQARENDPAPSMLKFYDALEKKLPAATPAK